MTYKKRDVAQETKLDVSRGLVAGRQTITVHGTNPDVLAGATEAITNTGFISFLTAPQTVRIKIGGDVADDAAGTGARSIEVFGVDGNINPVSEVIATAGAAVSLPTTTLFSRVYISKVVDTGQYAGVGALGSNVANIDLETSDGTLDLLRIIARRGISGDALFTVPAKKSGYITKLIVTIDEANPVNVVVYERRGADVLAAPYTPKTAIYNFTDVVGVIEIEPDNQRLLPEKTDIWAEVINNGASPSSVSIAISITILDN